MSVLEAMKSKIKELNEGPAGDFLNSAKGAMANGLDGAGKFVDDKTNGKYASQIHTGIDKAKGLLGQDAEAGQAQTGTDSEPQSGAQTGTQADAQSEPQAGTQAGTQTGTSSEPQSDDAAAPPEAPRAEDPRDDRPES